MSGINIPLDLIASRFNMAGRFDDIRSGSVMSRFKNLRPVTEFFDMKRLSKPQNFAEVQTRVNYNLSYFSSNYAALSAMLAIYTLITNQLLLFCIILVIGGTWGIRKLDGRDLEVGTFRATPSQLYTALLVISVPLFFLSNPWGSAFWLVGATGVTVLGHASFMDKPIESAFSEEAV